ncbi:MAG: uroporphyrinogen-III C-methyltransferase [Proteobacteria bacterium]|nr:uroporphyrinogen-III C-methyltransferase [Pseudomonadota bacterium]
MTEERRAKLFLIGAGPGDPELLTLKALRLLSDVDTVLYDNLVSTEILDYLFKQAKEVELIYVGKKCSEKHVTQDDINALILEKLSQGKQVARLKGGDPFIFARGVEEMQLAKDAGYEVEIVPGLTSGLSVPVSLGIPLTLRKKSDAVMIVSAHELSDEKFQSWSAFLMIGGTLLVYMGLYKLAQIREGLAQMNLMPAILIQSGTLGNEKVLYSTVKEIPELALKENFVSPSILILGRHIMAL